MYAMSSLHTQNVAMIKSPITKFQLCYLNFYYHMGGADLRFLNISVVTQSAGEHQDNTVFSLYGPQGSKWQKARVPIAQATRDVPYLVGYF